MCLAISKPAGKVVGRKILNRGWIDNADGAGFSVKRHDGEWIVQKGFFHFEDFWKAYKPFREDEASIHFRLATHGKEDIDNCHPFYVGKDCVVSHNGIISKYADAKSEHSDTSLFVGTIVQPLYAEVGALLFTSAVMKRLLTDHIGVANKLVFHHREHGLQIIGDGGEWKDGVWYSSGFPEKGLRRWVYDCYEYMDGCAGYGLDKRGTAGFRTVPEKRTERRCELCDRSAWILYRMGVDEVCGSCWDQMFGG